MVDVEEMEEGANMEQMAEEVEVAVAGKAV